MAESKYGTFSNMESGESYELEGIIDLMSITIIGSGDFGRGLALRMVQCGYNVFIGSRHPNGITK